MVGIGTTNPDQMLTVKGKIHTEELKVNPGILPDYVFEESYKLIPLEELELFIKTNKHLPGIPTAIEVNEKGMALGNSQIQLLKKIEELSLYLIDISKDQKKIKNQIESTKF
jgi:hypothetical protein